MIYNRNPEVSGSNFGYLTISSKTPTQRQLSFTAIYGGTSTVVASRSTVYCIRKSVFRDFHGREGRVTLFRGWTGNVCHCNTSWKVAGSIPDRATGIFQ